MRAATVRCISGGKTIYLNQPVNKLCLLEENRFEVIKTKFINEKDIQSVVTSVALIKIGLNASCLGWLVLCKQLMFPLGIGINIMVMEASPSLLQSFIKQQLTRAPHQLLAVICDIFFVLTIFVYLYINIYDK